MENYKILSRATISVDNEIKDINSCRPNGGYDELIKVDVDGNIYNIVCITRYLTEKGSEREQTYWFGVMHAKRLGNLINMINKK